MTLVIKKLNPEIVRLFKAEAVKRGLLLNQAIEEAITLWLNTGRSVVETDFEANNRVYESMKEELRKNHSGKFIVIAEGRLAGIFSEESEAIEVLRRLGEHIKHAILTRVGADDERAGELEWWGGSIERQSAQNS